MLYTTIEYITFFVVVFFASYALVKTNTLRLLLLLVASYYFYMSWNPYLIVLIAGTTCLDYMWGRLIHRASSGKLKKLYVFLSVGVDLGILGVFKYAGFFVESGAQLLQLLGVEVGTPHLDIILPVGISFYTFQSLSYTIDIYRGRLEPVQGLHKYALYIAFFPQLVAGPIVRASHFLPQLDRRPRIDAVRGGKGLFLILLGMAKKVVFADYLAVNLVDRVFETPERYTSLEVLTGVYGYALQIYCDFSGYSDIAIGSAMLLGFDIPDNFDQPYLSINMRDFWRRWHISLSSWLRDYLYIPLGGSKHGPARTYFALGMTMLLGGLWHGAAWTFVIWGILHGLALVVTRVFQRWRRKRLGGAPPPPKLLWRVVAAFVTFQFVCFCWVFFRAPDFSTAFAVLGELGFGSVGAFELPHVTWDVVVVLVVGLASHYVPRSLLGRVRDLFVALPSPVQALVSAVLAVVLFRFVTSGPVPFIYFQF